MASSGLPVTPEPQLLIDMVLEYHKYAKKLWELWESFGVYLKPVGYRFQDSNAKGSCLMA